jgi:dynein heavy chain
LQANELLEAFEKMNNKIESAPKDIEELTSIKDYMTAVPNEIEKVMSDLKACMNIYEILNQFNYKYHDDEDYDKKWRLFGSPKETIEKIDKQQSYLAKEQEKFVQ